MSKRSIEELRDELNRLMHAHIESVENETFTGRLNEEELRQQEERLKRIREVSADYLAALKRPR
jgi:CRISPR/Cas system-associated endoribonuclease Cas2